MGIIDGGTSPEAVEACRRSYAEMNGLPLNEVKAVDFGIGITITSVDAEPRMKNLTIDGQTVAEEVVGEEVSPIDKGTSLGSKEKGLFRRLASMLRR